LVCAGGAVAARVGDGIGAGHSVVPRPSGRERSSAAAVVAAQRWSPTRCPAAGSEAATRGRVTLRARRQKAESRRQPTSNAAFCFLPSHRGSLLLLFALELLAALCGDALLGLLP